MVDVGEAQIELDRLVKKVMSQRDDQDQAAHGDDEGLAQTYVGAQYAEEALAQIRRGVIRLREESAKH